MALFKFRQTEDSSQPAPSVEVLRQRAKHRLIGAVVLVSVGVVGFPLLVDKQPRPMAVDLPIDIPDKTKTKPLSLPANAASGAVASAVPPTAPPASPLAAVPAAAPVQPSAQPVAAAASLSAQESLEPQAAPSKVVEPKATEPKAAESKVSDTKAAQAKATPKPEAKTDKSEKKNDAKPAPVKPSDAGARAQALLDGKDPLKVAPRLVVQVGSFEDPKRAAEVRAKIERAGLSTILQVVETKDGKRTRVRLGPFDSKADADKVAEKIKKLDLPVSVLTL